MAQSVDPILLDSTGQDMVTALNLIANKTVDSALSDTSTNPVQNKVITGEINGIKEKIPSGASSSNKMATANDITGVQDNIIANTKLIKDTVGWSGKNKCPNDLVSNNTNNTAITVNADKSVSLTTGSGGATADTWMVVHAFNPNELPVGNYKLSGCPSGGSNQKYEILFREDPAVSGGVSQEDFGNGASFTISDTSKTYKLFIGLKRGQTASNLTFKPMIYDANILDDTYEPYFGSTAFPRSEQAVLGAKQWFDPSTVFIGNDYLFVTNSGKNIKIKNDVAISYCNGRFRIKTKPNTDYKLTTNIVVTSGVGIITVKSSDDSTDIVASNQYSTSGACTLSFNSGNNSDVIIRLFSTAETSGTGEVIYDDLLLSLASDTDRTWVPYAMTNKELTDKVHGKLDKNNYVGTIAALIAKIPNNQDAYVGIAENTVMATLTNNSINTTGKITAFHFNVSTTEYLDWWALMSSNQFAIGRYDMTNNSYVSHTVLTS